MGPKKGVKETGENQWRTRIEEGVLNQENWKVKVIMIEAAGGEQDCMYLTKFENFALEERRFVIKNICRTETMFMINQLGVEKKVKDNNLRVFEEGQAYLKEKQDIPSDILALTIKHLILKMKEEYLFIKRNRLEVKEGMRRESTRMINNEEVIGAIAEVKPPEPVTPPPKGKKNKGGGDMDDIPEPTEGKKYNTVLRERGEEWRDKVYIDDYPTDGPALYVAVTGFLDPNLANALIKIGVPLTAIVQVRINPTVVRVPSSLIRGKRRQSQSNVDAAKAMQFWVDIQKLRLHKDTTDDLRHTAFIIFTPPYKDSDSLSGEAERIYDEICYLLYDVQDLSRQHLNFLDNMVITKIPAGKIDDRYVLHYNAGVDDLPLECATIFSILDSMLRVACITNIDEKSSRSSLSTAQLNPPKPKTDTKVKEAEVLIKNVIDTLCKLEPKKNYRITYGKEYESHKDPVVIKYGNFAKYPTFHLGNIDLENIVGSTLYSMPLNKLWSYYERPEGELEAKVNFHVNVLLSCFERDDVETAELERLVHILACRKLYNNRSSLKMKHLDPNTISDFKKVYLKRSILSEPLPKLTSSIQCNNIPRGGSSQIQDMGGSIQSFEGEEEDPETCRIKFLFDCPDISELVSAAEIANNEPSSHIIDDYDYFEDFSGVNAFQIMHDVFNKYNCVNYKYCEVTDCLIIMFYNNQDKDQISREEWRHHLQTALCLQDFFDFALDEHYDWIKDQERCYDEKALFEKQSACQDLIDPFAAASCVDDTDVAQDLLMEGSLKYNDIHDQDDITTEVTTMAGTKTTKSISPTSEVDKSSRKSKSAATYRPRASIDSERLWVDVENQKPFTGYDISDRRVEVLGKDCTFFSNDGTRVTSKYSLLVPNNLEYIILNIAPGGNENDFWIHRALGSFTPSHIRKHCQSFRVACKDKVMINIHRQSYQVPVVEAKGKSNLPLDSIIEEPQFETKYYHSFCVSWPNGQITESVHEKNSPEVVHIKQYNVSSSLQLDEEIRCISLNGEVVIFKRNGDIEVLQPDGTHILISKYHKTVIPPEEDVVISEASSDKGKKGKPKDKGKPKKISSQNLKESIQEIKPLEYELHIDEFESVETDGAKKKWIQDESYEIERLVIRTATDYLLGEVFSRRMDGTDVLLNKDGVHVVTFPNKTRIITQCIIRDEEEFPEWSEEERDLYFMHSSDDMMAKSKTSASQKSSIFAESIMSNASRKIEEEEMKIKESDGYLWIDLIYIVEHLNFATVTVNKTNGQISVDSPNETSLNVDLNNKYELNLDKATTATFDGEILHINYEACSKCKSSTKCDVAFYDDLICDKNSDASSTPAPPATSRDQGFGLEEVLKPKPKNWVILKDSFSKMISVDCDGNINIANDLFLNEVQFFGEEATGAKDEENTVKDESTIEDPKVDVKSFSSVSSHVNCGETNKGNDIRFFIMRRDLRVSELIHRGLVEEYKKSCQWQPWCNIANYDTFGDHRTLHSVLKPINRTESEKWLMDSKLSDKPKYLTYKDLVKDSGKGFYHWMRPYERFVSRPIKPENVLPPRLPRAFILRVLEQQWGETTREKIKGARELLSAVLKYRHVMESDSETLLHIPLIDTRDEDERRIDKTIQAIGNRLYNNLRAQLDEDIQNRAKADITTLPPPPCEEQGLEGEMEEGEMDFFTYEQELQELEEVEPVNTELSRYWRRRAEEKKEEEFYWYLLREGTVPPYFKNMLGGAIWSEVNQVTDDSITKAQRRKMKCVCPEESEKKGENTPIEPGVFDVLQNSDN